MTDILNLVLAILVLALAAWTIMARQTFAAVSGFLPYGLLLTLLWLQLSAIDVALTEAVIGAGLSGALFIGSAIRLRATEAKAQTKSPSLLIRAAAALLAAGVAAALASCILLLPDPAPTLAHEVKAQIGAIAVGNPITAVLLAFRAMDTLLEAIVLLLALLGVWSLAPDRFWGGRPGPAYRVAADGTLAYLARLLPPIGIVIGIYILWVGADHPGGKFQGATILAAMWLLVMMAGLADAPPVHRTCLRLGLVAGPATFLAVGLVGVAGGGAFLAYPPGAAKLWIIVIEAALMPSLAITLALLLVGPPQRPALP